MKRYVKRNYGGYYMKTFLKKYLLRGAKSLYDGCRARVRRGRGTGKYFGVKRELRQGCVTKK